MDKRIILNLKFNKYFYMQFDMSTLILNYFSKIIFKQRYYVALTLKLMDNCRYKSIGVSKK